MMSAIDHRRGLPSGDWRPSVRRPARRAIRSSTSRLTPASVLVVPWIWLARARSSSVVMLMPYASRIIPRAAGPQFAYWYGLPSYWLRKGTARIRVSGSPGSIVAGILTASVSGVLVGVGIVGLTAGPSVVTVMRGSGVAVDEAVGLAVPVAVGLAVGEGVGEGEAVGVGVVVVVGVMVGVGLVVGEGDRVGDAVGDKVGVGLVVGETGVSDGVGVGVAVLDGVRVGVRDGLTVGLLEGDGDGDAAGTVGLIVASGDVAGVDWAVAEGVLVLPGVGVMDSVGEAVAAGVADPVEDGEAAGVLDGSAEDAVGEDEGEDAGGEGVVAVGVTVGDGDAVGVAVRVIVSVAVPDAWGSACAVGTPGTASTASAVSAAMMVSQR